MTFRASLAEVEPETLGYILAAVFFTIGIVGGLGEWVFHWWKDPWDWASPVSLGLGVLSLVWSASARSVRRIGRGVQHLLEGQERLVDGQERLVEGQGRLVDGQERLVEGQERLVGGQTEQTGLLREVVRSFRRG